MTMTSQPPGSTQGTTERMLNQTKQNAEQLAESGRRRSGRWAGAGAAVLAAAGAAGGLLAWRRTRRKPVSRRTRAWRAVTTRFNR